ncbi:MAG: OprO/OprP family phosphate-selective porin, partial [Gammaproteobacteria bacterium]|nr:OprO/OprP family phosphate-selective porin [Gammaproteobacteria bacterium]
MSSMAHAASTAERLENLETALELNEETNAELRAELENRMRISGYVDVEYVVTDKKDPGFRMHHLSLFFQKKLSDKWRFFSEIEYEDGPKFDNEGGGTVTVDTSTEKNSTTELYNFGSADGKIFVEAVNMDYLWKPEAIFRVGRFFTPAGIWSVDHYPPFVGTQERPKHIRKIFPQLVDGAMVYGTVALGKSYLKYDAFVGNGEGNNGHNDSNNQRSMGLKTSLVVDVPMFSHFEIGGTFYNDPRLSSDNANKTAVGGHAKLVMGDFNFQSEASYAKFEEETGGSKLSTRKGYYGQLAYSPNEWTLGARHDYYNDPDRASKGEVDRVANSVFVNYQALTNLVIKVEHHMVSAKDTDDSTKTILSVVSYLE